MEVAADPGWERKKFAGEVLLDGDTGKGQNKSLGAEGTTGLQGRGLGWKEGWFSKHRTGHRSPTFYGADSQMGATNVN